MYVVLAPKFRRCLIQLDLKLNDTGSLAQRSNCIYYHKISHDAKRTAADRLSHVFLQVLVTILEI